MRRTSPQSKVDDEAFPIRMCLLVPENGFGLKLDDIYNWLEKCIGRRNYAVHGRGVAAHPDFGIKDRLAIYFRKPEHLAAFSLRFPELELADMAQ